MGELYDGHGMMIRPMVGGIVMRLHIAEVVEEMFLSSIQ
jgi:hypothetical protein